MKQQNLYNLKEARRRRDEGMRVVMDNNLTWGEQFQAYVERLPWGWTGTGEDLVAMFIHDGGDPPVNGNAIGANVSALVKRSVLRDTGQIRRAAKVTSHARRVPIWRKA